MILITNSRFTFQQQTLRNFAVWRHLFDDDEHFRVFSEVLKHSLKTSDGLDFVSEDVSGFALFLLFRSVLQNFAEVDLF